MIWLNKWLNRILNIILTQETIDLIKDIYSLRKDKIKIVLFFIFLPFTILFLIENLFIYLLSLFFYNIIFLVKIVNFKIFKKKTKKIVFKDRFTFFKKIFMIFFKNMFFEYPKTRAFFNFYNLNKTLLNMNKNKNKTAIVKEIIKIIINRYLILIITGLPYLIIFCNLWLTNKFYLIYKLKRREKASYKDFFFILILNLNRDLMPFFKIYIKKLKIKFCNKSIVFNPKENIKKIITELAEKNKIEKQITNIKKNSLISFVKNIEQKNKNNNLEKWSKRHIESIIFLNEEEVISCNETSNKTLYNENEKEEIENIYYGNCSYKSGNCYITKPIKSKIEYKNFIKESINYNIKNIDYDKVNYNQILAILFNLKSGYIEAKYTEKENIINFYYKENKQNLIDLIRKNKENMENSTYESIENSNNFFEKIKNLEENLNLKDKILLTNQSMYYNLVNSNYNIYQLLKLK